MSVINFNTININEAVQGFIERFQGKDKDYKLQTSGSTGPPKTIAIKKAYMRASAQKTLKFMGLQPGDKALLCLPLDKIAGVMMVVRSLEGKMQLSAVNPGSEPLKAVQGHFHFAAMVPLQAQASLAELQRVDKLIIGGAPISAALERELEALSTEVYHSYGMTETISHVAMRRIGEGSKLFRALPGVSFKTDADDRLIVNAPDIGVEELLTNDLVSLPDPYSFRWLGRADHVVNSGGLKLHPEQIEEKLGELNYPYFLAGLPDERLGQKLVMIVETVKSLALTDIDFSSLGQYEKPRELYTLPGFSYTNNGKLKRGETIQLLKSRA